MFEIWIDLETILFVIKIYVLKQIANILSILTKLKVNVKYNIFHICEM